MAIVGGLDIHRRQITYDWIDTDTGETCRGQLSPATRLELRAWLARSPASRRTSRWRPPPAGGSSPRSWRVPGAAPPGRAGRHPGAGRPQAAGQDRPHRRPPPAGAAGWRHPARVLDATGAYRRRSYPGRLRRALVGERTGWYQRIHAIVFHHGLPERSQLLTADGGPGWPGSSCQRWPASRWSWP
jgi:transposase